MTWSDITVQQFQQLSELWQDDPKRVDPAFIMFDMVEIVHRLTPNQVDSRSAEEFTQLLKDLDFLNEQPDWKPMRSVTVNGRRYRFVYDVRQIHAARNIEVKTFGHGGLIPNMHKMAASMVIPQKRHRIYKWRWVDDEYDAAKHEQYAADMLQAPITSIHGSTLFFCEVFMKSIPAIVDYLTSSLPMEMRTEAKELLLASCNALDGTTTFAALQNLTESLQTRLTNYPTYAS